MADSKLANLLRNDNAWKGDADLAAFNQFEAQAEPWYRKGLPMEGRGTFLPFRDTLPNSVMNQREFALPSIMAAPINAITAPFRAATGSDPTFNAPEEAMNMAGSVFGGGVGTSRAMTAPMGVGGKDLAMNAYHGTPHEIKGGFDLAKVGTGEGAQSYGHGMYFGEARGTGEEYRKTLSSKVDVNGKPLYRNNSIVGSTGNKELDDYLIANTGDVKATRKQLLSDIKEVRTGNPTAAKEMQQTLADLRNANVNTVSGGNLYKVDIPDVAIPNMLDWDKPLSQQQHIWDKLPKEIRNSIDDALENNGHAPMSDALGDYTGRHLYKALGHHDVHESLPPQIGASDWFTGNTSPAQHTSAYLNSLGVTGVKYLDQGSRNSNLTSISRTQLDARINSLQKDVDSGKGNQAELKRKLSNLEYERNQLPKATSNFVVFDPTTVKILEKNDKPVDRKDLIKEQIDKLTE